MGIMKACLNRGRGHSRHFISFAPPLAHQRHILPPPPLPFLLISPHFSWFLLVSPGFAISPPLPPPGGSAGIAGPRGSSERSRDRPIPPPCFFLSFMEQCCIFYSYFSGQMMEMTPPGACHVLPSPFLLLLTSSHHPPPSISPPFPPPPFFHLFSQKMANYISIFFNSNQFNPLPSLPSLPPPQIPRIVP